MKAHTARSARVAAAAAALLVLATAAACRQDAPATPAPPVPVPGELQLRLTTPRADDGALLLELTGPAAATDVRAARGDLLVEARPVAGAANTVRVAVFGDLASGELLAFRVPDVNAAARWQARVVEVGDRAAGLRAEPGTTTLTVVR